MIEITEEQMKILLSGKEVRPQKAMSLFLMYKLAELTEGDKINYCTNKIVKSMQTTIPTITRVSKALENLGLIRFIDADYITFDTKTEVK